MWRALLLAAALCGALPAVAADATLPSGWDRALKESQAAIGRSLRDGGIDAIPMLDSRGRRFSLADLRGRPFVVSFIYTGCFQACPVATQSLAAVVRQARQALGDDRFEVVSIGFNQPFDTPEAMAAFARQARIDEPRWRFASPRAEDVPALARAFGFSWSATPKGFDHVTQATIVDAQGTIRHQVYGDTIEAPFFVGPLKAVISGEAAEQLTLDNLWLKVKLYCTVYDPASGRYRLDYSLFFEIFAGLSVLGGLAWVILRELRRSKPRIARRERGAGVPRRAGERP